MASRGEKQADERIAEVIGRLAEKVGRKSGPDLEAFAQRLFARAGFRRTMIEMTREADARP